MLLIFSATLMLLLSGCVEHYINKSEEYQNAAAEHQRAGAKLFDESNYKGAADEFSAAIDSLYDAWHACWVVGHACSWDRGRSNEAFRMLYTNAGWAKYWAGDTEAAFKDVKYGIKKYPDVDYPQSWLVLGTLYIETGNRDEALHALAELRKRDAKMAADLERYIKQHE